MEALKPGGCVRDLRPGTGGVCRSGWAKILEFGLEGQVQVQWNYSEDGEFEISQLVWLDL